MREPLKFERRDARFDEIVDVSAELEQLATGFDFTEGPVWHPAEQSVLFSDIMGNSTYRWHAETGIEQHNRHSYMANGLAYDLQGRLLACEHATSRLTRRDLAMGVYETLASHYKGKQLNSPNDVIVKSDGTIYFTDPLSGRSDDYGVPREPELAFRGVYRLDPTTGELTLLADDFELPNGLCFSRDESVLYVNDTRRHHIRAFAVEADGTVSGGDVWAETVGALDGVPDGMKVDSADNIYCTGPGGVQIFDSNGVCLGAVHIPEKTANFVFGGADYCSVFVTATTSLYRFRVQVAGWPTFRPKTT